MADPVSFALSAVAQIGISFLFPSEGPRMKDLRLSASTYSNIMPEAWGRVRVAGNMIWATPIKEVKHKSFLGKGGFSNVYTYFCDFAISWCRGPITDLRRIWCDGKLIYDTTGASENVDNSKYTWRLYKGDEDQLPDPLIQADKGDDNTPAYRGQCYMVFENFALEDFGNRIPQFAAEIYVGVPSDIAPHDDLVSLDGGLLTSYQNDVISIDPARGYAYLLDLQTAPRGIRRFRLSDGVEDRQILTTAMGSAELSQKFLTNLCTVMSDGSLVVTAGSTNSSPVFQLDPYSYTVSASFGLSDSTLVPDEHHVVLPLDAACSMTVSGVEYVCFVGPFGFSVLDQSFNYVKAGQFAEFAGNLGQLKFLVVGQEAVPAPQFWVFWGGSISSAPVAQLNISSVTNTGTGIVCTIPNPEVGGNSQRAIAMVWDQGTEGALCFWASNGVSYCSRFDAASNTIAWTVEAPQPPAGVSGSNIVNNQFVYPGLTTHYYVMNSLTGELQIRDLTGPVNDDPDEARANPTQTTTALPLPGGYSPSSFVYDGSREALVVLSPGSNTSGVIHVNRYDTDIVTLDAIVESLLRRGGLAAADFDLSALQGIEIPGYGYASATDVKGILAELKQVFLFDIVEINGQLKAVVRGGVSSSETISGLALGSTSPEVNDCFKETRIMEADLPAQIVLSYTNIDNDFQSSIAPSKRTAAPIPTMFSHQQVKIEIALSLDATTAQQRVNSMLYVQWGERTKHDTRLPWTYAYLDPTDLITVNLPDGRSYFERIQSTEMGADYAIVTETYGQDSGAYLSGSLGSGGDGVPTQVIRTPKPALAMIFNLPLLRDLDDSGGGYSRYYTAVGNAGSGDFFGATVFRSVNNLDYTTLYGETQDVEWGTVVGVVPPPAQGVWAIDWETQITISPAVSWFEIESITDDELLNLANICLVGNEVICFRDAVQNDDGTWTISNLLRGQRGTEWATDNHAAGDRFIFLSATTVDLQGEVLNATGQDRYFKAVGSGRSIDQTPPVRISYYPRDLMPYAPNDIRRALDTDITLTWARRTRMGGGLMDGTGDVPLNETSEAYEVYILDAPFAGDLSKPDAPAHFLRLYTTTTPTVVYSASDQTTDDFDANLDTLHVVIYQISGAVGRGFPGVANFDPSWEADPVV